MPIPAEDVRVGRYIALGGGLVEVISVAGQIVRARMGADQRVAHFDRATIARIVTRRAEG